MPAVVPKLKGSEGSLDVMKSEDKIDSHVRHTTGREPFFSFPSRPNETPVQWIQLLHALDHQELPGWPLLYPMKIQLQKCDKCSREFCSPINYRRHIRVHHRLKRLDKDSRKNRDLLRAYWDKLSEEEAKEVVSLKNVTLEGVPGSLIVEALTSLIQKPGYSSLPHFYLRAGAALLDIVQSKPSRFPLSSQDLFTILDDASEKTCLCGTAVSIQRYIFYGEAGKVGLEPKNLVACTSFLLEQKLVKACLADKDAEALRCQRQLVAEEEAAQKRQAKILERKRQKKLRQKDQKAREQRLTEEIKGNTGSTVDDLSAADASLGTSDLEAHNPETFSDKIPSHVPFPCPDTNKGRNGNVHSEYDSDIDQNIERPPVRPHNHLRKAVARQQGLPKSQCTVANAFHTCQNSPISKTEVIQKYGTHCDHLRTATIANGSKVWSRKFKPEINRIVSESRVEKEPDQVKNHEVLIGSIAITLSNCSQSEGNEAASQEHGSVENLANQNGCQDKPIKPDYVQSGNNRLNIKHWRPVSQHGTENPVPVQSGEAKADSINGNEDCQNLSDPSFLTSCSTDGSDIGFVNKFSHVESRVGAGMSRLSSHDAKAFLAQRWKEAISSNHLELVVSSDSETPTKSFEVHKCSILVNAENRLPATPKVTNAKPRMKPEKGMKIKYIPKQKTAT